jgi:hypothetical protein
MAAAGSGAGVAPTACSFVSPKMASGAVWPMRSFPASGVTGVHTIGVVRGPRVGPLPGAGRFNRYFSPVRARCTGRSGQEAARVASGGGPAGEMGGCRLRPEPWPMRTICGSKLPLRSRGTARSTAPSAITTPRPPLPRTARNRSGSWPAPARTRSPSGVMSPAAVTLPRPACRCSPSRQRPPRRLRVPRYPHPAHRDVPRTPPNPENTRPDPESPIGPAVTSAPPPWPLPGPRRWTPHEKTP